MNRAQRRAKDTNVSIGGKKFAIANHSERLSCQAVDDTELKFRLILQSMMRQYNDQSSNSFQNFHEVFLIYNIITVMNVAKEMKDGETEFVSFNALHEIEKMQNRFNNYQQYIITTAQVDTMEEFINLVYGENGIMRRCTHKTIAKAAASMYRLMGVNRIH